MTSFAIEVQRVWSFKIWETYCNKPLAISPCCWTGTYVNGREISSCFM